MADAALLTSLTAMAVLLLVSIGLMGRDLFRGEQRLRYRLGGGVLLIAMLGSIGLYALNGRLGMKDLPLSSRLQEIEAARQAEDTDLLERKTDLIKAQEAARANPDDITTLFELADAAARAGDSATEIATLEAILARTGNPLIKSMIGEALTREADGIVTTKALSWIEEGLAEAPEDWRGRYLKGLYLSQSGDDVAALRIWAELAIDLEGTEIYPAVVSVIREAAARIGADASAYLPSPAPGPEAIAAMITGLESRLFAEAGITDAEGWTMLIRSLTVFGDQERRDAALAYFLENMQGSRDEVDLLLQFTEMLLPPDDLPEVMPEILGRMLSRARDISPDDSGVLFFSGLYARSLGQMDELKTYWGQLQARLEKDNPLWALLDAELAKL